MSNLEELSLFLSILMVGSSFIDGVHLHDQILSHMPRLNKFNFSICTVTRTMDVVLHHPSNDDVQRTFIEKGNRLFDYYVDHYHPQGRSACHVYSLPYVFDEFLHLTNRFPGGKFSNVRHLVMKDDFPFDHEFFKRISEDFSCLRTLAVVNVAPQKSKQEFSNDSQSSTIITFAHLTHVYVDLAHVDYVEQFLFSSKTCLPCLRELHVTYEALATATNCFTSDAARVNCAQLKSLVIEELFVCPRDFYLYFPSL
jgi:hypothetical protein